MSSNEFWVCCTVGSTVMRFTHQHGKLEPLPTTPGGLDEPSGLTRNRLVKRGALVTTGETGTPTPPAVMAVSFENDQLVSATFFDNPARLSRPRGIASTKRWVFVADSKVGDRGIVVLTLDGQWKARIKICETQGDVSAVAADDENAYFGTDQGIFRIEIDESNFTGVQIAKAVQNGFLVRGLALKRQKLLILGRGEGKGVPSQFHTLNLKKLGSQVVEIKPAPPMLDQYYGICALGRCGRHVLLTAQPGRGRIVRYDQKSKGERERFNFNDPLNVDSIQGPLGIIKM